MGLENFLKKNSIEIDKSIGAFFPRRISKEWLVKYFGEPDFSFDLGTLQKSLVDPMWDFLDRGGKRWRPSLMLLCAEAVGGDRKKALRLSPIPELLHSGCVSGDTLIWMADGRPKKIVDVKEGEFVLSLSPNGEFVAKKVEKFHNNGVKKVFSVKLSNREIEATANHPFLTVKKQQPFKAFLTEKGKKMVHDKIALQNLTVSSFSKKFFPVLPENSFSARHMMNVLYGYGRLGLPVETSKAICSVLSLDFDECWRVVQSKFGKASIVFSWVNTEDLKVGGVVVVSKEISPQNGVLPFLPYFSKSHRDRYVVQSFFSVELAQLCGFILGDGSVGTNRVSLCLPKNMPGREEYEILVEKVFGAKPTLCKNEITICSKAVFELVSFLGFNKKALEKDVPQWVFTLPKEHKMAFIRGYLDADGTVGKNGTVAFECASEQLIRHLKCLLDANGFVTSNIHSRVVSNLHFSRCSKKTHTRLFSIQLFSKNKVLNEIGSEIKFYRDRLSVVAQRQVSLRQTGFVPSLPRQFSNKSIGFSRVAEIKCVGEKETFDIQVQGTHNYISNGIITHNTIVVDDIEDGAELRRGKPAMHKMFGIDIAINNGMMLYYLPMVLIPKAGYLSLEQKNKLYKIYVDEMLKLSFGQGMDIFWHRGGKKIVSEENYLQMCSFKTGTLARLSAKFGAVIGGADEKTVGLLGDFANTIGVAFQIRDDVLNLSEERALGKEFAEDIHEGKRTLMVIHAFNNSGKKDAERLLEIVSSHTPDDELKREAISIMKKAGSMEYASKMAERLVRGAWKKVDKSIPASESKSLLREFADYLVERKT